MVFRIYFCSEKYIAVVDMAVFHMKRGIRQVAGPA